jgi:hypothetical protein
MDNSIKREDVSMSIETTDIGTNKGNGIQGQYSNRLKVGYNGYEFVLDFAQYHIGEKKEDYHTRIITTPAYAKSLLDVLQKSIDQYEKSYGSIG